MSREEIQAAPVTEKRLYTTMEAAAYLGVSEITIRVSRQKGRLLGADSPRFLRFGRNVRYAIEDINEWIENKSDGKFQTIAQG